MLANVVVIAHRCPLVRRGLRYVIERELPLWTWCEVANLPELLMVKDIANAALLVCELYEDKANLELNIDLLLQLQQIRAEKPMLVITERVNTKVLFALKNQPSVSLLPQQVAERVLQYNIIKIINGERVIPKELLQQQRLFRKDRAFELTDAESRVLNLMQSGYSVTNIALILGRSIKTISAHKRNLMIKTGSNSEVELFSKHAFI